MYSKICKNLLTSLKALLKSSGAPLTYFNDGGCPSDFFGSEILAQSDFFGVYERCRDLYGSAKKPEGFFGGCEKGLRDFLVMLK